MEKNFRGCYLSNREELGCSHKADLLPKVMNL